MLKLSVELHPESLRFEPTTPTLLDPLLDPLPSSRLTEPNPLGTLRVLVLPDPPRELELSTRTERLFLDPLPELDPSTKTENLFLDPRPELVPSTKTENDPSLGSETPSVPVLVPEVVPLLSARSYLTTDNGRSSNTSDSEVFLSTTIKKGPCPPTGPNLLSVTDPSLTS
jgi:hypothetical protein